MAGEAGSLTGRRACPKVTDPLGWQSKYSPTILDNFKKTPPQKNPKKVVINEHTYMESLMAGLALFAGKMCYMGVTFLFALSLSYFRDSLVTVYIFCLF